MSTPTKTIRLMKHYVTDGTTKARVHYSYGAIRGADRCVTIYAKDYGHALGAIFDEGYENDTDTMTDYFDKGRVRILPSNPLWADALSRCHPESIARFESRVEAAK